MPRRRAPWMREADERKQRHKEEARVALRARGSRVYAVLPWRSDARYDGADVIRWFRHKPRAESFAMTFQGGRGQGLVVRNWTLIQNSDAEARAKTPAELERDIAQAIASYRD